MAGALIGQLGGDAEQHLPVRHRKPQSAVFDVVHPADHLALAWDSHTNNTSLALAIELWRAGPVLLFPGDAQVGNWLSWDDHEYPGVTATDLLRRV